MGAVPLLPLKSRGKGGKVPFLCCLLIKFFHIFFLNLTLYHYDATIGVSALFQIFAALQPYCYAGIPADKCLLMEL